MSVPSVGGKLVTQRDINCLTDPDRSTRKRALEKILKTLGDLAKDQANFTPQEAQECLELLHGALIKLFKDSAEKCRELSVAIVTAFVPLVSDVGGIVDSTVKAVRERIGDVQVLEESEEVRLALMSLATVLVSRSPSSAPLCVADLASICEKGSLDKFPDAKRAAAELAVILSDVVKSEVREFCPTVIKALCTNLGHQQQKTRIAALNGIGSLIPCADAKVFDDIMPFIAKLNVDRAHQVREAVLHVVSSWLLSMPSSVVPKLLPVLLHGVSDELDSVRESCVELVDSVGMSQEIGPATTGAEGPPPGDKVSGMYPSAFKGKRPCEGARQLVRANLEGMIPGLVTELVDWTPTTRGRAASTLLALVVYAEGAIAAFADTLLGAFAKAYMDDDEAVANRVGECVCLAGAFIPAQVFVGVIASNVQAGTMAATSKRNWIAVLAALVEGSSEGDIAGLLPCICDIVKDMELSMPEEEDHQIHLLRVLRAAVSSGQGACAPVAPRIFPSLLRLQSLRSMPTVSAGAADTVAKLAGAIGLQGGAEGLYAQESQGVLEGIMQSVDSWRRDSKELQVFETLLRSGGESIVPHLEMCMPAFALVADANKDADVRSCLILLLDYLLAESGISHHLSRFGGMLLSSVIVPVCVWRAGKVASALRKAGCACMKHLVGQKLVKQEDLSRALGEGFTPGPLDPIIKSCLEDDDADIRFIACGAIREIFVVVRETLDTEQLRLYYAELLKRLDDSNDTIRCEAAGAFKEFLASVPQGYDASQYEYLLRGLVVHLDDSNEAVQQAVLPAVLAAAPVNTALFTTILKDCKGKHRSGKLCGEALEHAAKLEKNSNEVLE